jgi:hypothetical protein
MGVEVKVGLEVGVEVEAGCVSATSIWAVSVKAERSSRTMVGVGLALLGDAQAVKLKKISKIVRVKVFIFIIISPGQ